MKKMKIFPVLAIVSAGLFLLNACDKKDADKDQQEEDNLLLNADITANPHTREREHI